jgi:hypothetical protein
MPVLIALHQRDTTSGGILLGTIKKNTQAVTSEPIFCIRWSAAKRCKRFTYILLYGVVAISHRRADVDLRGLGRIGPFE